MLAGRFDAVGVDITGGFVVRKGGFEGREGVGRGWLGGCQGWCHCACGGGVWGVEEWSVEDDGDNELTVDQGR